MVQTGGVVDWFGPGLQAFWAAGKPQQVDFSPVERMHICNLQISTKQHGGIVSQATIAVMLDKDQGQAACKICRVLYYEYRYQEANQNQ